MMKKVGIIMFVLLGLVCLTNCEKKNQTFDKTKNIIKYSRDVSSGTRDGFFTSIGFSEAKEDDTKIPGSISVQDNANMISLIKNDKYGIGYISLSSLASSGLKALNYGGVIPSEETVVDGSYKLARNFNYVIRTKEDCSNQEWLLIKAFELFMNSKEGQGIIKAKDGILTKKLSQAISFDELLKLEENKEIKEMCEKACDEAHRIEIKFGGSTSVEKIARALSEAFSRYCPTFKPVHNHTGSSAAFKGTQGNEKETVNSMHIGFLSRELSASEKVAPATSGLICKDGIVVVVNAQNDLINDIDASALKKVYSSQKILWSEIIG